VEFSAVETATVTEAAILTLFKNLSAKKQYQRFVKLYTHTLTVCMLEHHYCIYQSMHFSFFQLEEWRDDQKVPLLQNERIMVDNLILLLLTYCHLMAFTLM